SWFQRATGFTVVAFVYLRGSATLNRDGVSSRARRGAWPGWGAGCGGLTTGSGGSGRRQRPDAPGGHHKGARNEKSDTQDDRWPDRGGSAGPADRVRRRTGADTAIRPDKGHP